MTNSESRGGDALRLVASLVVLGIFAFVAWRLGLFKPEAAEKVSAETERAGGIRWIVPIFVLVYAGSLRWHYPSVRSLTARAPYSDSCVDRSTSGWRR